MSPVGQRWRPNDQQLVVAVQQDRAPPATPFDIIAQHRENTTVHTRQLTTPARAELAWPIGKPHVSC
jgi:hypothetical protein